MFTADIINDFSHRLHILEYKAKYFANMMCSINNHRLELMKHLEIYYKKDKYNKWKFER